jgi:hypothetical protein
MQKGHGIMKSTVKKHNKLKLDLKREQLRVLTTKQLALVAGGDGEETWGGMSSCTGCNNQ